MTRCTLPILNSARWRHHYLVGGKLIVLFFSRVHYIVKYSQANLPGRDGDIDTVTKRASTGRLEAT